MDQREHAMDPSMAPVSTDRTGVAAGALVSIIGVSIALFR
jgi:hypothetical protein